MMNTLYTVLLAVLLAQPATADTQSVSEYAKQHLKLKQPVEGDAFADRMVLVNLRDAAKKIISKLDINLHSDSLQTQTIKLQKLISEISKINTYTGDAGHSMSLLGYREALVEYISERLSLLQTSADIGSYLAGLSRLNKKHSVAFAQLDVNTGHFATSASLFSLKDSFKDYLKATAKLLPPSCKGKIASLATIN